MVKREIKREVKDRDKTNTWGGGGKKERQRGKNWGRRDFQA